MIDPEDLDTGNEIFFYFCDEVKGEIIGTGDGVQTTFEFQGTAADWSEIVYIDGVKQTNGVDYNMTYFADTGNSLCEFNTPPESGTITASYAKVFFKENEALLSEDVKIDANPSRIETDVHGRNQKLKKSTCYDLKITLKQVFVDTEILAKVCGNLETGPISGTRRFKYGPANKIHLLFGKLVRNDNPIRWYYLWGVAGLPSISLPAKDYFRIESTELTCDHCEIIEYGTVV
jgi:hypothetical protein